MCRSLKSCKDVGVACRTDLPNSLLLCTIFTTPDQDNLCHVGPCLDTFLSGSIEAAFCHLELQPEPSPSQQNMPAATAVRPEQAADLDRNGYGQDAASGIETTTRPEQGANSDRNGYGKRAASDNEQGHERSEDEESVDAEVVDDYLKPPVMHRHWQPLVITVGVPALPKGALVEVQPEAFTVDAVTQSVSFSSDDEEEAEAEDVNRGGHDEGAGLTGHAQNHRQKQLVRMPGWPGQLVHEHGSSQGPDVVQWLSLAAVGSYCCCLISFRHSDDLLVLRDSIVAAQHATGDCLSKAGLSEQHIWQATVYTQWLGGIGREQFCNMLDEVWQVQCSCKLAAICVPVSHVCVGSGPNLRQIHEHHVLQLTAHAL